MKLILLVYISFLSLQVMSAPNSMNTLVHKTNAATGAQSWELNQHGVVLYMNQLLPDQLKAFYSNRGFTQEQIKTYVNSCVFMTVLRNESASGVIHYQTKDWTIVNNKNAQSFKSVETWLQEYKQDNIKKSALIAFRWAQFPIEQEYEPGGDWNQGMLSLGAQVDDFDLIARWKSNHKAYQLTLRGMRCAK